MENGLTLQYLKEELSEILNELDGTNPENCNVFYHPSLGRTRYYARSRLMPIFLAHLKRQEFTFLFLLVSLLFQYFLLNFPNTHQSM